MKLKLPLTAADKVLIRKGKCLVVEIPKLEWENDIRTKKATKYSIEERWALCLRKVYIVYPSHTQVIAHLGGLSNRLHGHVTPDTVKRLVEHFKGTEGLIIQEVHPEENHSFIDDDVFVLNDLPEDFGEIPWDELRVALNECETDPERRHKALDLGYCGENNVGRDNHRLGVLCPRLFKPAVLLAIGNCYEIDWVRTLFSSLSEFVREHFHKGTDGRLHRVFLTVDGVREKLCALDVPGLKDKNLLEALRAHRGFAENHFDQNNCPDFKEVITFVNFFKDELGTHRDGITVYGKRSCKSYVQRSLLHGPLIKKLKLFYDEHASEPRMARGSNILKGLDLKPVSYEYAFLDKSALYSSFACSISNICSIYPAMKKEKFMAGLLIPTIFSEKPGVYNELCRHIVAFGYGKSLFEAASEDDASAEVFAVGFANMFWEVKTAELGQLPHGFLIEPKARHQPCCNRLPEDDQVFDSLSCMMSIRKHVIQLDGGYLLQNIAYHFCKITSCMSAACSTASKTSDSSEKKVSDHRFGKKAPNGSIKKILDGSKKKASKRTNRSKKKVPKRKVLATSRKKVSVRSKKKVTFWDEMEGGLPAGKCGVVENGGDHVAVEERCTLPGDAILPTGIKGVFGAGTLTAQHLIQIGARTGFFPAHLACHAEIGSQTETWQFLVDKYGYSNDCHDEENQELLLAIAHYFVVELTVGEELICMFKQEHNGSKNPYGDVLFPGMHLIVYEENRLKCISQDGGHRDYDPVCISENPELERAAMNRADMSLDVKVFWDSIKARKSYPRKKMWAICCKERSFKSFFPRAGSRNVIPGDSVSFPPLLSSEDMLSCDDFVVFDPVELVKFATISSESGRPCRDRAVFVEHRCTVRVGKKKVQEIICREYGIRYWAGKEMETQMPLTKKKMDVFWTPADFRVAWDGHYKHMDRIVYGPHNLLEAKRSVCIAFMLKHSELFKPKYMLPLVSLPSVESLEDQEDEGSNHYAKRSIVSARLLAFPGHKGKQSMTLVRYREGGYLLCGGYVPFKGAFTVCGEPYMFRPLPQASRVEAEEDILWDYLGITDWGMHKVSSRKAACICVKIKWVCKGEETWEPLHAFMKYGRHEVVAFGKKRDLFEHKLWKKILSGSPKVEVAPSTTVLDVLDDDTYRCCGRRRSGRGAGGVDRSEKHRATVIGRRVKRPRIGDKDDVSINKGTDKLGENKILLVDDWEEKLPISRRAIVRQGGIGHPRTENDASGAVGHWSCCSCAAFYIGAMGMCFQLVTCCNPVNSLYESLYSTCPSKMVPSGNPHDIKAMIGKAIEKYTTGFVGHMRNKLKDNPNAKKVQFGLEMNRLVNKIYRAPEADTVFLYCFVFGIKVYVVRNVDPMQKLEVIDVWDKVVKFVQENTAAEETLPVRLRLALKKHKDGGDIHTQYLYNYRASRPYFAESNPKAYGILKPIFSVHYPCQIYTGGATGVFSATNDDEVDIL